MAESRIRSSTASSSSQKGAAMSHSRSSSSEAPRLPLADVEKDLLGLRAQILDNVRTWYGLKHPGKDFDFSVVTCSYRPPQGRNLFSAMVVATYVNEAGIKEIHSKHDVRSRDSVREDTSKSRIEALEVLLEDLEWRMDMCMHQYETKLKRAPRADRKPWQ